MTKKIKVMQVTHDLSFGGLQRIVVDICTNIDKSIFDISVCCLRDLGEFTEELKTNSIRVFKVPPKANSKTDYFSFLKLYKILRREFVDILHTHNTQPFVEGTIAGKIAGIPSIIHTDHARQWPDKKRYMFAEWFLSHFVNKIVAVSENVKQDLITYEKINPQKITIILNGINGQNNNLKMGVIERKKALRIENYSPILGLGVRLTYQKGITYLLKAMPEIIKHFPRALLLIIGGGELRQNLEDEACSLGICRNVRFLGPRLDMKDIIQLLDIYVLPSLWEGLPLVVLEAMAAKKPIVATAVGGTPTAIIHGESGILVPAKEPTALTEAILNILKNSTLAKSLSKNAYRRFTEQFSVERMVSNYQSLYLKCYTACA
ncbi:MAG: glycosyltransferase family 4 protein [Candidatus Hodarchaeota archaeon]